MFQSLTRFGNAGWRQALWAAALLLSLGVFPFAVRAESLSESQIKAAYLFSFAKFTRWPAEKFGTPQAQLRICVMGAPDVAASLHQVDGRKIDEHPVGSTILQSSDSAQDCHILYLGDGTVLDTGPLKGVLRGVLVVSDRPGVGAIRFVNMDQRLRFSVDLHQTHAADISLSADVLSLAIAVEGRTKE